MGFNSAFKGLMISAILLSGLQ